MAIAKPRSNHQERADFSIHADRTIEMRDGRIVGDSLATGTATPPT